MSGGLLVPGARRLDADFRQHLDFLKRRANASVFAACLSLAKGTRSAKMSNSNVDLIGWSVLLGADKPGQCWLGRHQAGQMDLEFELIGDSVPAFFATLAL